MRPTVKRAIIEARQREKEKGNYNIIYSPMGVYNERSGSRGVSPNGTSYPIYPSMNYPMGDYTMGDYDIGYRFRDRRGREHYDNGRYAPMNTYYDMEPQGYIMPYIAAEQEYNNRRDTNGGRNNRRSEPMNKIGFANPDEFKNNYDTRVEYPYNGYMPPYAHHEKEQRKRQEHGYAMGEEMIPFDREDAKEWTRDMENEDGTKGPHWTWEQTRQIMEQQKINCDEAEFYAAVNMMYSDYCKVAKKFNCNTLEFYACMAKAFLDDKDAGPDKLAKYYEYIVK